MEFMQHGNALQMALSSHLNSQAPCKLTRFPLVRCFLKDFNLLLDFFRISLLFALETLDSVYSVPVPSIPLHFFLCHPTFNTTA